MISNFPNSVIATVRPMQTETQAGFHAASNDENNIANRLVQLIAGPWGVSMNTNLTFHRSGTGDAGRRASRVPSLPFSVIHHFRQPAIPDGGRWQKIFPCNVACGMVDPCRQFCASDLSVFTSTPTREVSLPISMSGHPTETANSGWSLPFFSQATVA